MAREVTSRMNRIIELLITSKYRNLKEIADVLGITLRQIRYDIDRINSNFVNDHILMIETDNTVNTPVNTPVNNGDTTASVKTGDESLAGMFATIALLSVAGYTVLRKKED